MGQRATRRTGLPKTRGLDAPLQRVLDGLIERVEVFDGIRGDSLDSAVTFRDLNASGFNIVDGGGGSNIVTGLPNITDGSSVPGTGPAAAPTNLAANETFLALLLTWDNPSFNLQHIEVHRSLTDNLSTAVLVGTTVAPLFVDYVGGSATFYYWVRAVGTDGTFSAFNATAGTLGTTGVDPSDFEVQINVSTANLDAALAARIDLIDFPTTGLVDRMVVAEGDIVTSESNITTLQSDVSGLTTTVGGHTTSINANASSITTNQTNITTLQTDVLDAEGNIVDNTTAITVNASSILNLEAQIGGIDAENGQTWEFNATDENFTVVNSTKTTSANALIWTPSTPDPQLISEAFSVSGGIFTQVVMRVRQIVGGGAWEGACYYETTGHAISGSFLKVIPDPAFPLTTWKTLTWDMADLTAGGTDWIDSTITKLRFDLVSDAAGKFEIDWIIVAKFSTSAISEAISGLDVRVTVNEGGIASQATAITALESTVDDVGSGVTANAAAVASLTTDVISNDGDISANAAAILGLQTTVDDPTTGVVANAAAITILEVDVSDNDGILTSQASSITQLVASMNGAFGSPVNPLNELNEGYGTTFLDADIQAFGVGNRVGVAARQENADNNTRIINRADNTRLKIEPGGVYEIRFSVFHNRPTSTGSFLIGFESFAALTGGTPQDVVTINDRVAGNITSSPLWLSGQGTIAAGAWQDISCYIIGADVDVASCPNMVVNGETDNTVLLFQVFNDGFQPTINNPYIELKIQNFNVSPFGDSTTTTLYITDFQVSRIDAAAGVSAALQVQASVSANEFGDLHALYAVNVELSTGDDPYITGFGLTADIIDGVATSAFGIRADQFFIVSPSFGTAPGSGPGGNENSNFPFIVDLVGGVATVGIDGALIVDGTITASAIVAGTIGAGEIFVNNLSALSADMGTLTSGLIRTAASPAFRVEIEDQASTGFPLWYGSGSKGASTGRFYVDQDGNVVVKGLLDAAVIKQSFFTPAGQNQSFRIATEYPNGYTGGLYTGKKAHLMPVLTTGFQAAEGTLGNSIDVNSSKANHAVGFHTSKLTLSGPFRSNSVEYGRLGSYSENLAVRWTAVMSNDFSDIEYWAILKYQYDAEPERMAHIYYSQAGTGMRISVLSADDIFVTRDTPWSTLKLRLGLGCEFIDALTRGKVNVVTFTVSTANFGYADLSGIAGVTGATSGASVIARDPTQIRKYL